MDIAMIGVVIVNHPAVWARFHRRIPRELRMPILALSSSAHPIWHPSSAWPSSVESIGRNTLWGNRFGKHRPIPSAQSHLSMKDWKFKIKYTIYLVELMAFYLFLRKYLFVSHEALFAPCDVITFATKLINISRLCTKMPPSPNSTMPHRKSILLSQSQFSMFYFPSVIQFTHSLGHSPIFGI
jgi:hypothetical protein